MDRQFQPCLRLSASSSASAAGAPRRAGKAPAEAVAGISGIRQNAAVALCLDGHLSAFCEQERVTRVRRAGIAHGGLPLEALDTVLNLGDLQRSDVRRYVVAEPGLDLPVSLPALHMDHHQAHAATAYYLSPFDHAVVFICDHHSPAETTVWAGGPDGLRGQDWPETGQGFASLYSECAALFGYPPGNEHQLEAIARLDGSGETEALDDLIAYRDGALVISPAWKSRIAQCLSGSNPTVRHRARVAGVFQRHVGALLLQALAVVRKQTGLRKLALGGGLFYNTWFTTVVRQSGLFDDVFVAPNPGNAGIAAGAALSVATGIADRKPASVSPFLGPEYDSEEIKRTLDNCKLSYEVLDESQLIETTVAALTRGELIGWFQGRMEWGHRALGNRSILASPLSPYVLDNLNVYLKHRERHRTYGVSVPVERAAALFSGPPVSRFMEYEYAPVDRERVATLLPEGGRSLRVQTIPEEADPGSSSLFRTLHEQFGQATGVPILVNTSFNGFREPMVCSPRDAVRVFFGSGLDRLVLGRFVVRK